MFGTILGVMTEKKKEHLPHLGCAYCGFTPGCVGCRGCDYSDGSEHIELDDNLSTKDLMQKKIKEEHAKLLREIRKKNGE